MHEQHVDDNTNPQGSPDSGATGRSLASPGVAGRPVSGRGTASSGLLQEDLSQRDAAGGEAARTGVPGTDTRATDRSHGRRALWISVAGLVAVAAAAVPVVSNFAQPQPEHMHTPAQLAGLTLDTTTKASDTSDYLRTAVAAGMSLDSSVGAVYTDGQGDAHSVIFVGGTSRSGSADARLTALFGLMSDSADGIAAVRREDAGALGGEMKCGVSTDDSKTDNGEPGGTMTVCGWADTTTVGIALFPNRTVDQAATLLRQMRPGLQGSA